jgi:hypothetical protein
MTTRTRVKKIDADKGTKKWIFDTESGTELGGVNFHNDDILFGGLCNHCYRSHFRLLVCCMGRMVIEFQ